MTFWTRAARREVAVAPDEEEDEEDEVEEMEDEREGEEVDGDREGRKWLKTLNEKGDRGGGEEMDEWGLEWEGDEENGVVVWVD